MAKDTNATTNPVALDSIAEGTGTLFTNVAYNTETQEVWWEGKTPEPPTDLDGWHDWMGNEIADRSDDATTRRGRTRTAASPPRSPTSRTSPTTSTIRSGVPIDGIIFGGRTRDREPLIRAINDLGRGRLRRLTLGAEATFAAEGIEGQLRYDPMSMRPFMAYPEGKYAEHWLRIIGRATEQPIFAHVNWFQRDPDDGHFLWPGYRENLRPLLWLMQLKDGEVSGARPRSASSRPRTSSTSRTSRSPRVTSTRILSIDADRWHQEMINREEHLKLFEGLPEDIWAGTPEHGHRRRGRDGVNRSDASVTRPDTEPADDAGQSHDARDEHQAERDEQRAHPQRRAPRRRPGGWRPRAPRARAGRAIAPSRACRADRFVVAAVPSPPSPGQRDRDVRLDRHRAAPLDGFMS